MEHGLKVACQSLNIFKKNNIIYYSLTVLNVTEILVFLFTSLSYNLDLISCFQLYLDSPVIIYKEQGSTCLSIVTLFPSKVLLNVMSVPDPKVKHAITGPNVSLSI